MKVSFTLVFSGVFIAYVLHSVYSIAQLYYPPSCNLDNPKLCLSSFLTSKPSLQLLLVTHRTELHSYSQLTDENLVATWSPLDYSNIITKNLTIPLPRSTKRNGTLYLYAFLTELPRHKAENWISTIQQQTTMTASIQLTQYLVPEAKTFNLLGTDDTGEVKKKDEIPKVAGKEKPIAHITKKLRVTLLTDLHVLPRKDLQDLAYLIRIIHSDTYLPPLRFDKFASRIKDYHQMNKSEDSYVLELEYAPTSLGNLRLNAQFEGSMESMGVFGFTQRDLDDVKAIFLDTNVYLIGVTMIVASVHILFDFLAFKNDVNYWRHRKTTVGLSSRSILWRCFSSIVVLLYLLEEKSSLLIIVPGGIGAVIEVWKVTKAFKIKVKVSKGLPRITFGTFSDSEKATAVHDVESMRYLSYLLYPLIACGAVYSLLYTPHKSWYSWTIQTMVNGVYCFGFLFMLPQLFVNYRLKSVAHLPWRAFMYKAFNTFIDDLFAFIITMPTAHRLACFRDDIVFIVYLYQRWLYPVDQTRLDAGGEFEIDVNEATASEAEKKKN